MKPLDSDVIQNNIPVALQAAGIATMASYGVIEPIVGDVATGAFTLLPVLAGNYALNNLPDGHPFKQIFAKGMPIPETSHRFKNIMPFAGLVTAGLLGGTALHACISHGWTDPNIYKLAANAGPWTIQGLAFYAHGTSKDVALPGFIREAAKKLDQMNGPYFTEACNVAGGLLLGTFGACLNSPRTIWIGGLFASSGAIAIIQNAMAGQNSKA
jgi:hypothetical protein